MSEEKQEVNVEELSLEELRALALKESGTVEEEEKAEETEEKVEEKPTVFRREIDLGDGSGKQVFEAESLEALTDKLVEAQRNATKKIRELSREVKVEKAAEKEPERELTADEEFLLSQELLNHPSKTQKKLLEGLFGMSLDEVKAAMEDARAMRQAKRADEAANKFIEATPDFHACPANAQRINKYLSVHKLECTVENLATAYEELNSLGLLEQKPQEQTAVSADSETADQQETSRIAKATEKPVVTQRRVGSGLSSRGRSTTTVKAAEPTEDELYDMPLDKLAELARKAGRQ